MRLRLSSGICPTTITSAESVLRLSTESVLHLLRVWNLSYAATPEFQNLSYNYYEYGICPTLEYEICLTSIASLESVLRGYA